MEVVLQLVALNHRFIPLTSDLLEFGLRANGYSINEQTLKLLDGLKGPDVILETAVFVAVEFLRNLALNPIGKGFLASVTGTCCEALVRGRSILALAPLKAQVDRRFALLPIERDELRAAIDSFIAMKARGAPLL